MNRRCDGLASSYNQVSFVKYVKTAIIKAQTQSIQVKQINQLQTL